MGPRSESCVDCNVGLSVVQRNAPTDGSTEVVLAIDYVPSETEERPRIADIRLVSNRDLTVVNVEPGEALLSAGKSLFRAPGTGELYRHRPDGSIQFLALSLANTQRFGTGRLMTVTVRFRASDAVIRLQRRDQTFAPPLADNALQLSNYDAPVVVVQ